MQTDFRATNQNEIEFTLTVTMELKEWRNLKNQLDAVDGRAFPAWRLVSAIRDMVDHANTHWVEEANE